MKGQSKPKFRVRRCYDKELIKQLHSEIFPEDEFYEDEDSADWILYNSAGKAVGFCMMSHWKGKVSYFARAGVLEEVQGMGLHLRLIKVREAYCKRNSFTKIVTYTKIYNVASARNLQKSGFYLYTPEIKYADDDCNYWMKTLKVRD